jgi:hypothetical protein
MSVHSTKPRNFSQRGTYSPEERLPWLHLADT